MDEQTNRAQPRQSPPPTYTPAHMHSALFNVRPLPRAASKDFFLLMLLGALLFSAGLGLRGPWPSDEPRLTLIAAQIAESGHWLTLERGPEIYPRLGPLYPWITALWITLTDSVNIGFLLPSLFAALLTLLVTYDLGKRLWNPTVGLAAGLSLLLTLQFVLQARTAQVDALLCLFTTLSIYGFARALLLGHSALWLALAWGAIGLGLMVKPTAWLAALVLVPILVASAHGWRQIHVKPLSWLIVAFYVPLAVLPTWVWLKLLEADHPVYRAAYLDYFFTRGFDFGVERWTRTLSYFPLEVIPLFWLPLALALPWAAPAWWRRLKRRDGRYLALIGFVLLSILVASFLPNKRNVDVLFAVPVFALALAPLVPGLIRHQSMQRSAWALTLVLAGLVFCVAVWGWLHRTTASEVLFGLKGGVKPWNFLGTVGLIGIIATLKLKSRRGLAGMAVFFCATWWLYGAWAYPLLEPQRSGAAMMERVGKILGEDSRLGLIAPREQIVLNADRKPKVFGFARALTRQRETALDWAAGDRNAWVLLPRRAFDERCFLRREARHVGRLSRQNWYLLRGDLLDRACEIAP
jgi:4-amino-4-deoxy-L-arabinose transferase-like glycosyltransferase